MFCFCSLLQPFSSPFLTFFNRKAWNKLGEGGGGEGSRDKRRKIRKGRVTTTEKRWSHLGWHSFFKLVLCQKNNMGCFFYSRCFFFICFDVFTGVSCFPKKHFFVFLVQFLAPLYPLSFNFPHTPLPFKFFFSLLIYGQVATF